MNTMEVMDGQEFDPQQTLHPGMVEQVNAARLESKWNVFKPRLETALVKAQEMHLSRFSVGKLIYRIDWHDGVIYSMNDGDDAMDRAIPFQTTLKCENVAPASADIEGITLGLESAVA